MLVVGKTIKTLKKIKIFNFLLLSLLLVQPAFAVKYSIQNSLDVSTEHNDNIKLTPVDQTSLQGRSVQPRVYAKAEDEGWDASIDIDLSFNNFNRSQYDSDDQFIRLSARRFYEQHSFILDGAMIRDSTRTSELDTSGIVTDSAIRRENNSVTPQWIYQINERNQVSVNASYLENSYGSDRFTNYDYYTLGVNWTRTIDEDLRFILQINGTQYEPDEQVSNYFGVFELATSTESTAYGMQVGGEYSITEKLSINGLVGSTYTDQKYNLRDPQDACNNPILESQGLIPPVCTLEDYGSSDFTANFSVNWYDERNKIGADYSIKNQPSSQGYEVQYERFKVRWKYSISEKSSLNTSIEYGINNTIDGAVRTVNSRNINRDFTNTKIIYSYSLTEHWRLKTTYLYGWQEREAAVGDAESNSLIFGFEYKPAINVWSR